MTNSQYLSTGHEPAGCAASSSCGVTSARVVAATALPNLIQSHRPDSRYTEFGPAPCPDPHPRDHRRHRRHLEWLSSDTVVSVLDGRLDLGHLAPRMKSKNPTLPGRVLVAQTLTVRTGLHPHRTTVRADMQTPGRSGWEVRRDGIT